MIKDYDGETKVLSPARLRLKRITRFIKENSMPIKDYVRFNDFASIVRHDASEPHRNVIVLFSGDSPIGMFNPKAKTGYVQAGFLQKEFESALAAEAIEVMNNRPKKDGYLGKQHTIGPGWAES